MMAAKENDVDQLDQSVSIKVLDTSKLPQELQESIKEGQEYSGEDVVKFFNTLKVADKLVEGKNKETLSFSKESIGFELQSGDQNYTLNVKLGQGNFEKGLSHLIALGSKDLSREKIQEPVNEKMADTLSPGLKKDVLDNVLESSLKSLKTMTELAGDDLQKFLEGFKQTYNSLSPDKKEKAQEVGQKFDIRKEVAEFTKEHAPKKEKEQVRTNEKTLSMAR